MAAPFEAKIYRSTTEKDDTEGNAFVAQLSAFFLIDSVEAPATSMLRLAPLP
jgi:hypothetical protein